MTEHIIAEGGCRVCYDTFGRGEAILLIPGLGGAARFWSEIAELLAERYAVIAVDHRGAGRSDRPDIAYSIADIASDCAAILRDAGHGRAHIVGHSTGGLVAQSLALDHPGLVDNLVLSGTWHRPDLQFREMFRTRLAILRTAGPQIYQRLTHVLGFPASWFEEHRLELERAVADAEEALAPIQVAEARIRMLLDHDRSNETGCIQSRALVIAAEDDAIVPLHLSEHLAESLPNARLKRTRGAHFFPRAHPEWFAGEVLHFLEEL